jgi:hypothetical protein
MSTTTIEMKYETQFTEQYVQQFFEGPVEELLGKMRDAAGKTMAGVVRSSYDSSAVGRRTGNLYRSINAKKIRRQPGTIGVIAGAMGKGSRHRELIEWGTKPHLVRPRGASYLKIGLGYATLVQHPGSRPYPFVQPAMTEASNAGWQSANSVLNKYIDQANALQSVERA